MDKPSSLPVNVYPKAINHIAVSVTDLDKAVKWYQEVFGFTVINGPVEFEADDSSLGMAAKDIHGPNFKKMRMIWLSSGNQIGIEIFEYIEPKAERRTNNFEYWKSVSFISVLQILTLKSYVEKFLIAEANSVVKYGILFQTKDTK
jgi:hypothetical protein